MSKIVACLSLYMEHYSKVQLRRINPVTIQLLRW